MTWLASIGIGFLSAIIGAFGTGGMGTLCVDWYRVPSREGGAGYFVLFLGLLGGAIGFAVGVLGARIVASNAAPSFLKGLATGSGSVIALVLIATFICWFAADLPTTIGGKPAELSAEVRCPPGFIIPANASPEHWYAHLDTRKRRVTSRGPLRLKEARREDERWIIPMTLGLDTRVREKLLYVRFGEELKDVQLFVPIFSSRPRNRYVTWSEWQDGGWDPNQPRPAPENRFKLRFRVCTES